MTYIHHFSLREAVQDIKAQAVVFFDEINIFPVSVMEFKLEEIQLGNWETW